MAKVLYIQASARGDRSASINVADAFLEEYKKTHPDDEIITMNLFETDLPTFDQSASSGKYAIMSGEDIPDADKEAWQKIVSTIDHFKSFDKYVFAVAMWNFGVPYVLKQFIDIITQPGHTFKVENGNYIGLVTGKPAFVAFARGGQYEDDYAFMDWQKPYFEFMLKFIGFTDIHSLVINPTLAGPDVKKEKTDEAIVKARELASSF